MYGARKAGFGSPIKNKFEIEQDKKAKLEQDRLNQLHDEDRIQDHNGNNKAISPPLENRKTIHHTSPLNLPQQNPFIPKQFELYTDIDPAMRNTKLDEPVLLRNDNNTRVWYRQDFEFKLPYAFFYSDIKTPYLLNNSRHEALSLLYIELVAHSFASEGYQARLAGYDYSITQMHSGIRVHVHGFSSELTSVLHRLLGHLFNPTLDESTFQIVKSSWLNGHANYFTNLEAWRYAQYFVSLITEQHKLPYETVYNIIQHATLADMQSFIPQLYTETFLEMYMYGNTNSVTALNTADYILNLLSTSFDSTFKLKHKSSERAAKLLPDHHMLRLPKGSYLYQHSVVNTQDNNNAVYISIFTGHYSDLTQYSLLNLLLLIVKPICFYELRTVQQLGYVVQCIATTHFNAVSSLDVVIQGTVANPLIMDEAAEKMIINWNSTLTNLSDQDFNTAKNALIGLKQSKSISGDQTSMQDWNHIIGLDKNFKRNNDEAKVIATLTKQQLIQFYSTVISNNNPKRRRLSVQIFSTQYKTQLPSHNSIIGPDFIITDNNLASLKQVWREYQSGQQVTHKMTQFGRKYVQQNELNSQSHQLVKINNHNNVQFTKSTDQH